MSKIEQLLKDATGATIISIDTITQPKLKGGKANPLQGCVDKKMVGGNVMIFQNKTTNGYENMVNRRLVKEGKEPKSFQVGPRQWGTRRENSPFVDHNGKTYLEVIFLRPGKVTHFVNGKEVDPKNIEGLERDREEGEQGGLEDKVIIRTFNIDNIFGVTVNGQQHYL